MRKPITTTVPFEITLGRESIEVIATIRFRYVPAFHGSGPSYASGGDPPEPESVEDVEVVELRFPDQAADLPALAAPEWLSDWIVSNVDHDELIEAVPDGTDPDYAYERARDDGMEREWLR